MGIGTLVMNPVAGGNLAEASPILMELVHEVGAVSVPDLAVRYVLANANVDSILCGMTKLSDVDDTLASANRGPLTAQQVARVNRFIDERQGEHTGFCTGCKYCMPCPQGISIPKIMHAIYLDRFLGLKAAARRHYRWGREPKADACVQCGECEEKCTQHIGIIQEMAFAAAEYGPKEE
jgi:predicted aldo/keto reductase-like oxidoreductase